MTKDKIDDILVPGNEWSDVIGTDTNSLDGNVDTATTFKGTVGGEIWYQVANCYGHRRLSISDVLLSAIDKAFASPTRPQAKCQCCIWRSRAAICGTCGKEVEHSVIVGNGGIVRARDEGVVREWVRTGELGGRARRVLYGHVDGVWYNNKTKPESKDDEVHDEQPAEVDEIGDDSGAKVTFDLLHMAIPEPVAQCNSQARLDLGPFLHKKNKQQMTFCIIAMTYTCTHKQHLDCKHCIQVTCMVVTAY